MAVQVDTTDQAAMTGFVLSLSARTWIRFLSADSHCSFAVPADSSLPGYRVASAVNCTCDEHLLTDARCAHIWAVRFHLLREQGEEFVLAPCEVVIGREALK
jgi:hypothetical protein